MESAIDSVKRGETAGVLYFYSNFSSELQKRRDKGRYASNNTIERSSVIVQLDSSGNHLSPLLFYFFKKLVYIAIKFYSFTYRTVIAE